MHSSEAQGQAGVFQPQKLPPVHFHPVMDKPNGGMMIAQAVWVTV